MKKLLLLITVAAITFVLLPLLGNQVVQKEIDNRITTLQSYGLQPTKTIKDISYFKNNYHYEFEIKESEKFLKYLQQFSQKQLPSYTNAIVEGVKMGVDIECSNFLFDNNIKVDIYPLSFSTTTMQKIKHNDKNFYKYIITLLQNKAILYHINYDVLKKNFDGYIKDIDEKYTDKNGYDITLKISKAVFDGAGELIAPQRLKTTIKDINLVAKNKGERFVFKIEDFLSTNNFESATTYLSTAQVKALNLEISSPNTDDVVLNAKDIYINTSSNTQNRTAQFDAKSSLKNLNIKTKTTTLDINNFNYEATLKDIDKESFEKLRTLISNSKINYQHNMDKQIQEIMIKLVSKGFAFHIADLSIKDFSLNSKKRLKGFCLQSDLSLKNDPKLAKEIQKMPLKVLQNIVLNSKITLSEELIDFIAAQNHTNKDKYIQYANKQGDDFVYVIKYQNSKFTINNHTIK